MNAVEDEKASRGWAMWIAGSRIPLAEREGYFGEHPMSDLISRARALRNLGGLSLSSAELAVVDGLIPAASQAVERFCRRTFALANYDELHDGGPRPTLLLHQYPVVVVERIACDPGEVLRVANGSSAVQQALVRIGPTGSMLTRIASGIASADALTFADCPTLNALAAAIVALGNGWSAQVVDPALGERASLDLAAFPGAFAARDMPTSLRMHRRDLDAYRIDPAHGIARRLEPGRDWNGGPSWWRVVYAAGFDPIPDDVQEACAELVAQFFRQTKRDPGLTHEAIGNSLAFRVHEGMAPLIRQLLDPHRRVPRV